VTALPAATGGRARALARGLAMVAGLAVLALGLRAWPLGALGPRVPWLTFYPTVMVAALLGGLWAGLALAACACAMVGWLWPVVLGVVPVQDSTDLLGMAVFFVNGALVSVLAEAMRRAKRQLLGRAEALARSNQDLERFAFVASHDLQEPLRMMSGFAGLLRQRCQGRLGVDADEYVAYIVDAATRMSRMVEDLLVLSRLSTRAAPLQVVVLDGVLDEALGNLASSIAEAGATIRRGPLPAVLGDRGQLVMLLQNLVGNAVKFRGDHPPRVEIEALREGRAWRLSLSDDGIGLEPEHLDRVFEMFWRLHPNGRYPGTGIGLALCRKIVERHGGRIWVESAPGRGSTFHVLFPDGTPGAP